MSTIVGTKVIVVGGGLAGLSAAHEVLQRGGRVLLLDMKTFPGGNSVKATSGINGALTNTQIKLQIPDSAEIFEDDTAKSGAKGAPGYKSTPLMKVLTHNSGPDVEWLINHFGLDLSLVSRLGGHTHPRTHRGGERFPGMTITYALLDKFEEIVKSDPTRACLLVECRATKLVTNESNVVIGCEYKNLKTGQTHTEYGPVVIATGGFGADFSENSLLKQVRPDLMHLPTTNGDHCQGDGIKMTQAIGGATVDLPAVQVHPTGLVHPNEPDAKIKFLAAEALRGVGGLLLDSKGKRFSNELGTRDYVTGEMWKNGNEPFRLILNGKGIKEIEWHVKHYVGRGLMKHFKSGNDLAKEMGLSPAVIEKTFKEYNEHHKNNNDPFGKKYFQNMPWSMNDEFAVSVVTPVVHYCMGGVKINEKAEIVRDNNEAIKGLYAGGEVAGGVHGQNRLGGSGLLGAVVYGRVAGASASGYLFDQLSSGQAMNRANRLAGQLFSAITIKPQDNGISINFAFDDKNGNTGNVQPQLPPSSAQPAPSSVAVPAPAVSKPVLKEYTVEEVAKHNTEQDCWVIVNGQVLDATSFLDKHPGGKQVILLYAGKDCTEEFNMLHKPDVVEKYAPEILIGTVKK